ncbi:hypothetical protein XM76_c20582 [Vibrio vulnificus]|nr:hypothetical protein XM76_c20582 [Vibrio vulnificus]
MSTYSDILRILTFDFANAVLPKRPFDDVQEKLLLTWQVQHTATNHQFAIKLFWVP